MYKTFIYAHKKFCCILSYVRTARFRYVLLQYKLSICFLFISIPKRHGLYPGWINSENGQICIQEARHWKRTSTQKRLNPLTFATHVVPSAKRIFACSLAFHNWCWEKTNRINSQGIQIMRLQHFYIVVTYTTIPVLWKLFRNKKVR